jgi:hypothetical protein
LSERAVIRPTEPNNLDCSALRDLWVVIVCVRSSAFLNRSSSVGSRASKEDEILIWIRDYKGSGTPWLLLKCLMEGDSCSLITQKQLFDFVRGVNRD